MPVLDEYRDEIFQRYVVEDMKRDDLKKMLRERHRINITASQLRDKLSEWGYRRNTSRGEARLVALEFGDELAQYLGNSSVARHRPSDAIEQWKHFRRAHPREYRLLAQYATACRDTNGGQLRPTTLERPLLAPISLRATTKFQYDLKNLIHRSFQSKAWEWQGDGLLIVSSPNASTEKSHIMRMIHGIDLACHAAREGCTETAQSWLEEAFEAVDHLVGGQYHDNIPNILAKINDLNDRGFREAALRMKQRVLHASRPSNDSNPHTKILYEAFEHLELEHLGELEERCGVHTTGLFNQYVGLQCYSSFVMKMNSARRRLVRNKHKELDELLPDLTVLDAEYGEINCRSMDVLRIRMEVLYHRECEKYALEEAIDPVQDDGYASILFEAQHLIDRAERIANDRWKYNYFLIKAHYHLGLAHYYFGNYLGAKKNFRRVHELNRAFREVDRSGQFDGEVAIIEDILRHPELALINDILPHPYMEDELTDGSWEIVSDSSSAWSLLSAA